MSVSHHHYPMSRMDLYSAAAAAAATSGHQQYYRFFPSVVQTANSNSGSNSSSNNNNNSNNIGSAMSSKQLLQQYSREFNTAVATQQQLQQQQQHQQQQHESGSLSHIGSSLSSSLALDLNGYDQAIQDLTESLNEVKITAALALQESQLVREQMQQGILSVLSELSTMWCQDFCPPTAQQQQQPQLQGDDFALSPSAVESIGSGGSARGGYCGMGGVSVGGGGGCSSEDQRTNFRYKTQLCKNFMAGGQGRCTKGEACQYAHGRQDLRRICDHPRYKTKMCSLQISLGVCPHGASCFFSHHQGELRAKEF